MPATARSRASRRSSMTETFVAAKLYVDNWRWADTPFYVRMGKRLARRETTIAIQFKRAPHPPFEEAAGGGAAPERAARSTSSPTRASRSRSARRCPGQGMTIRTVHMDFLYGGAFRTGLPEAYERLILDAMLGDATLFTRTDEVEEQWALVDAIVAAVAARPPGVPELRRRHVGAAVRRRAPAPRRPLLAPALSRDGGAREPTGRAIDVSIAEIEPELARAARRRRPRGPADLRTSVHDAHRLGAGGVASSAPERARRARASVTRRVRSCSCPIPRRTRTRSTPSSHPLVHARPRRPDTSARGDRASPARRPRGRAGQRRRAARSSPTCPSSCAGAAEPAVRRAAVRAARRRRRPRGRRLLRVAGRACRVRRARAAVRAHRRVRHRLGRGPSPGAGELADLWPEIADVRELTVAARGRRRSARGLARLAAGPEDRARARAGRLLESVAVDGARCPSRAGRGRAGATSSRTSSSSSVATRSTRPRCSRPPEAPARGVDATTRLSDRSRRREVSAPRSVRAGPPEAPAASRPGP